MFTIFFYLFQFNLVYIGGRPRTTKFRFRGRLSDVFVGSAPLTANNIADLHKQALSGAGINPITIDQPSVHYCTLFLAENEVCFVDDFENNDFK